MSTPAAGRDVLARPGGLRRVLLGLLPLWILLCGLLVFPGYMEPMFLNPPSSLGLPLGVVVVAAALAVMAIGVVTLHTASSNRSAQLAFVGLTLPAAIVIVVAPALVLRAVDLASR